MTHDEMIAVITHHKNGGKVEFRCKGDDIWVKVNHIDAHGFNFGAFEYRAKPEPLVLWYLRTEDGECYATCYSRNLAEKVKTAYEKKAVLKNLVIKKFVEVEE
jgi:hypothetical protein